MRHSTAPLLPLGAFGIVREATYFLAFRRPREGSSVRKTYDSEPLLSSTSFHAVGKYAARLRTGCCKIFCMGRFGDFFRQTCWVSSLKQTLLHVPARRSAPPSFKPQLSTLSRLSIPYSDNYVSLRPSTTEVASRSTGRAPMPSSNARRRNQNRQAS